MIEMLKNRYAAMPADVKMKTESNLEKLIESAEASRLFLDKSIVDSMICEATELLKYIHNDRMEKRSRIKDALEDMRTEEVVVVWNYYIDAAKRYNYEVHMMDDFDLEMNDRSTLDVITDCFHGEFNPNDYYWYYTEDGDISSFDYWDDDSSPIDLDEIAAFAAKNGNDMGNDTIGDILDGKNEEEE